MRAFTTDVVKPSQLNTSNMLIGSPLGSSEKETVARNIIIFSRKKGDQWRPFTFKQYQQGCTHAAGEEERQILDIFVRDYQILAFDAATGAYSVTNPFIYTLREFVKEG